MLYISLAKLDFLKMKDDIFGALVTIDEDEYWCRYFIDSPDHTLDGLKKLSNKKFFQAVFESATDEMKRDIERYSYDENAWTVINGRIHYSSKTIAKWIDELN